MCGITSCLGEEAIQFTLKSLIQLQNRGYDSAGVCSIINGQFLNSKYASTMNESSLEKLGHDTKKHVNSSISIGHTRWATHGPKTDINAHPHICCKQMFSLVHNGIIENYKKLKNFLEDSGFTFSSETDTEVIVNLLSFYYQFEKDVVKAI